jgi:polysaccharide export outer membrane protein
MNRLAAAGLAVFCASGCYRPGGAFVSVEAYQEPATGEYLVAVGDVLQVTVFQQESMSARVKVRPDGRVSLPLLNELVAVGKSPLALGGEVEVRLRDFVNKPSVRVSLEETRPLAVSVVGEVLRPGSMTLEPNAGVLQALAAGGGFTEFAHRDGIFVLRSVAGEQTPRRVRFTWDSLARGLGSAAQFRLAPGDVVVVE